MSTWINPTSASTSLATGFGTGSSGQVLTSNGSTASWVAPATSGTVTSVATSNSATALTLSGGPITSSGTLALSYSGTALPILNGGTGGTTQSSAFNALSPITTPGDMIAGQVISGSAVRVPNGTTGQFLTANTASLPTWTTTLPIANGGTGQTTTGTNGQLLTSNGSGSSSWTTVTPGTGTVTSVGVSVPSVFTSSGGPITSSGTIALSYSGTALPILNGGTGQTTQAGINPFGSTNYGAITYGGVGASAGILGSGATVGLTLTTGGGTYNPAWTYGGCGNRGNWSTITFNGSGGTYSGNSGVYNRDVSNLNTTLGSYSNVTTVNLYMTVSNYPVGFTANNTFYLQDLPYAAYTTQRFLCTVISAGNFLATVVLQATASSTHLNVVMVNPGTFTFTSLDVWYLAFSYDSY